MMLGGCGGSDPTHRSGEVTGRVYTFFGSATSGTVRLHDMADRPLSEPVPIDSNGYFSIFGEGLPPRFLVVVADVEPWDAEANATSAPHRLKAIVEYSEAMRTNVTPLTSMVARYAVLTGETLDTSDRAVGNFLAIRPIYSPSKLAPVSAEDLEVYQFSFDVFRAKWATSGLSLQDYLKQLAERVRNGETTLEFGNENVSGIFSAIGKWMLDKILDGIGDKIADAGIGWISRLVFGEQPDKYMDKLNEISGKLDDIKNSIIDVGQTLEQEIKDLGQDIKLDLITTQINIFAAPLGWYDQLVVDMPYHSKRLNDAVKAGDKQKEEEEHKQLLALASTITDGGVNSCYNRTTSALGTMHDMIALSHGGLGRSLYSLVAEAMTGKIESGALSLDKALNQYMELFAALSGAQMKGLLLQVEFLHKQHEGSDENCRRYVDRVVALHKERIDLQAEEFLNGLERLLVLFAEGDSIRDYRTSGSFPADGGSKYYARFDSLVGDMLGADSQMIVRLTWDAKIPDEYPNFFSFMKERMNKLENPEQALELQLEADYGHGQRVSPVKGKENGTVNPVTRKKIGEGTETKAIVRRYVFRNLRRGTLYSLTAKSDHLDTFNAKEGEIPLPGSVGPSLLPHNDYSGKLIRNVLPYADDDHRYMSIPLFAWLPEPLMLDCGTPLLDGPASGRSRYRPLETSLPVYGVKSYATGRFVQATLYYAPGYAAVCGADANNALGHRLEPTAESPLPVEYDKSVISIVGVKGPGAGEFFGDWAYFRLWKDRIVIVYYLKKTEYYLFRLLPAPTFVQRFIAPAEAKIVREGIPFRIFGIEASKLACTGSQKKIYPVNVHDGTIPPEELFSFERLR